MQKNRKTLFSKYAVSQKEKHVITKNDIAVILAVHIHSRVDKISVHSLIKSAILDNICHF